MLFAFTQLTGLVSHSISLETAAVGSSTASEKVAFIQLLGEAKQDFPDLATVTTDGHTGIAAYMAANKDSLEISHCLDVWHFVKNFKKALHNSSTRKVICLLSMLVESY